MVTVTIPAFNSAKTLKLCLGAVARQTHLDFEVVIIDGNSTDNTARIAGEFGVDKFLACNGGLLEARFKGAKEANGEYVLLLDSDQVLAPDALERAIAMMEEGYDMLVLEERSYRTETFAEKLFNLDRKLLHTMENFDPAHGALLPRFYKTDLLREAMKQIPSEVVKNVGGEDHAIIYWEAWQLSQKVGMLSQAVRHIEPRSLRKVWRKAYRWGETSRQAHRGKYGRFLSQRPQARLTLTLTAVFRRGLIREGLASLILILTRGLAYKSGYWSVFLTRGRESKR